MRFPLKKKIKIESGQVFPLALAVLAIGSLLVGSFIALVQSNLMNADIYSDPVPENYTVDAGIEDAIWALQYGSLADTVAAQGGQYSYVMDQAVNNESVSIMVTETMGNGEGIVAYDDFEGHPHNGGYGWLDGWSWHGNEFHVTIHDDPYQPDRHALIDGAGANVKRSVDLSGASKPHLTFWAKADALGNPDKVFCMVSPDGSHWYVVAVWFPMDSDDVYRYYDIDLSYYNPSSEFWIRFESYMVDLGPSDPDYFFFDMVQIVEEHKTYLIESVAGDKTATVKVEIGGTEPTIISWEVENT